MFYNTLMFRGKVMVRKYPESRFNTLTKKAFDKPCLVILKNTLNSIYIEFNKTIMNEIMFLSKIVNKKDRVSWVIKEKTKLYALRNLMPSKKSVDNIQWYDLTVSYMMSNEGEYKYLINLLIKQKELHYLTIWINTLEIIF